MADYSSAARYGDAAPSAANVTTSPAVSSGIALVGIDTVYDFTSSRRTSSFLGQDSANVFALLQQATVQWLDFYSNKTS